MRPIPVTRDMRGKGFSDWETQMINLKDSPFNAVGDGVVDDTAALQMAIEATDLNHEGTCDTTLWIPDGNYRFSNLILPARVILRGESMWNTVLRRTDDATGTAIIEASSAVKVQIFNMTISGNDRPGTLLDLGNVTGNPQAFSSGALLDNLVLRDSAGTLLNLLVNASWIGRIFAFNSDTECGDPMVSIAGGDLLIDQLDLYNNTANDPVALQIAGANHHIKRLYIEGRIAEAVEFAESAVRHRIESCKISLTSGLALTDLIEFNTGAVKNVLDHVLVTKQGATTVTNVINDTALGLTLTNADYDVFDRSFSYRQAADQLDGMIEVNGAYTIQANKPYGVVVQTGNGTIKLPSMSSSRYQVFKIVNNSDYNFRVRKSDADGSPTYIDSVQDEIRLYTKYESVSLVTDGTEWFRLGGNRLAVESRAATPAQITANQDNYSPSELRFWRLSSDASRNITGIGGGGIRDGQRLTVVNVGAQNIVFTHQDVASSAANRIITDTGANVTLAAGGIEELIYDETTQRWRMLP